MKKQLLLSFSSLVLGLGASAQASFVEIPVPPALAPLVSFGDVSAPNVQTIWAFGTQVGATGTPNVARQTFFNTANGGATWNSGEVPTVEKTWAFASIEGLNETTAWATFYDSVAGLGKIFRTTDGGQTWQNKTQADMYSKATSFANLTHFFDLNNGMTMGDPSVDGVTTNAYFEIWLTADGGDTWTRVPTASIPNELSGEFGIVDHYSAVGNAMWFITNKGRLYRTDDKGATWKKTTMPFGSVIPNIEMRSATHGMGWYSAGAISTPTLVSKTEDSGVTFDTPVDATVVDFDGAGNSIGFYIFDAKYVPGTETMVGVGSLADAAPVYVTCFSVDNGYTWHLLEADVFRNRCAPVNEDQQFYGAQSEVTGTPIMWKNGDAALPAPEAQREELDFTIYPNPVNDVLEITANLTKNTDLWFSIENSTGRVIRREFWSDPNGTSSKSVNVGSIPPGVYTIRLSDGSEESIRRFIVIH